MNAVCHLALFFPLLSLLVDTTIIFIFFAIQWILSICLCTFCFSFKFFVFVFCSLPSALLHVLNNKLVRSLKRKCMCLLLLLLLSPMSNKITSGIHYSVFYSFTLSPPPLDRSLARAYFFCILYFLDETLYRWLFVLLSTVCHFAECYTTFQSMCVLSCVPLSCFAKCCTSHKLKRTGILYMDRFIDLHVHQICIWGMWE